MDPKGNILESTGAVEPSICSYSMQVREKVREIKMIPFVTHYFMQVCIERMRLSIAVESLKNIEYLTKLVAAIILGAGYYILLFSLLIISNSNFAYDYVCSTQQGFPLVTNIAMAGTGTYLLWVLVIYISAAWLHDTKHSLLPEEPDITFSQYLLIILSCQRL